MSDVQAGKRRWQFSLGALFIAMSLVAFATAAVSGSFGTPVRSYVTWIGVMILVVGAGAIYYGLALLLLGSPFLLAVGIMRMVSRVVRSRDQQTAVGPGNTSGTTHSTESSCESP